MSINFFVRTSLTYGSFTFLSSHLQTVAADVVATRTVKHRRNTLNSW